jgi:hypothetical protein
VTQKQIIELQDPRLGLTGMVGFKAHKVNGLVPVIPMTNEVIPDKDKSVGIALFDSSVINEKAVDEIFKKLV